MALFFLAGSNNHGHLTSFHLGPLFDLCKLFNISFNPLHELHPDFLVRHLPSAEADGDLALVPMLKETYQVAQFDLIIPFFSSWTELDLFDLRLLLLFLGSRLGLFLFEDLLAVVHYLTDDRIGIRNLNQVKRRFFSFCKRFRNGNNPHLFAFGVDQADFSCVNIVIDGRFRCTPTPIGSLFDSQISV